jgi:radical SAM protein with 4Fe4S-binding SPASM domain
MTRFARIIQILDDAIGGPGVSIAVHGPFWRGVTRDQFVAKQVLGLDLLVLGDGAGSNLVKALKGESPFGQDLDGPPPGARFDRMPSGLDPVSPENIAFIQKWIDDGCPEDAFEVQPVLKWRPTNAPIASSRTDDIWFTDPQTGWAVNSNGQILKTTDGGASWTEQLHDPEVYFRCIGFASPSRGWAGTLTGHKTLFETRDSGATWTAVTNLPANPPSAICGISVVNEQVVYASGTNFPNRPPRMMKTRDGGATWTAWDMRHWASILIDTFFTSPTRGWVVGGKTDQPVATRANVKPVVLLTEDGGQTWEDRVAGLVDQLHLGEWGWKIFFLDDRIGFVSLENFNAGAILKTIDGGRTWTRLPINDPQKNANLEGVGFIDENQGWVGGWGDAKFQRLSTSQTVDGGRTWTDADEVRKALNRFRFFGKPVTVGYASGQTVYKFSARSVAPVLPDESGRPRLITGDGAEAIAPTPSLPVAVPEGARRLTVRIWDRFGEHVATPVDEVDPVAGASAHSAKLRAAEVVRALGLPLTVNVVLHRLNIDRVGQVVALAERLGAHRLELAGTQYHGWTFANRAELLPGADQVRAAERAAAVAADRLCGRMDVVFVPPDYFGDRPKPCLHGWGRRYLTVNPVGDVLPCPTAGSIPGMRFENARDQPLGPIWRESEAFNRFRGTAWMPEPCRSCELREVDFGGCRCQAALLAGDASATDPACSLSPHREALTRALLEAEPLGQSPGIITTLTSPTRR